MSVQAVCPYCRSVGTIRNHKRQAKRRYRAKFGLGWLLLTILTFGLALIPYVLTANRREVVGVDRYTECTACGTQW